MDFAAIVDSFPWESKEQKEGYLALVQYEKQFGYEPKLPIDTLATFLIQKNFESHEYWRDAVGTQVKMLQDEIKRLQDEVASLIREVDTLQAGIKAQSVALEALGKKL